MTGQGKNVQIVIQEDAGTVGGKTQDEPLIKSVNHILVSFCPKPASICFRKVKFNKPKSLKVAKEDQMLTGLMVDRLSG